MMDDKGTMTLKLESELKEQAVALFQSFARGI